MNLYLLSFFKVFCILGNPCPPEPRCPLLGAGPPGRPGVRHCESQCIYEYITTVNGAKCKIRCTLANGPPGPPGEPCPPTNVIQYKYCCCVIHEGCLLLYF